MVYNYHRYYDPAVGRYITSDPVDLFGGLNTYAYVDSNPLTGTDFYGLFEDPECSWVDKLLGRCKDFKNIDEYLDHWLDKQKDKICQGKRCDQIFNECKKLVVRITWSTGPIEICIKLKSKCDSIKQKCKDKLACNGGSGSDIS